MTAKLKERLIQAAGLIAMAYALYYIGWRWAATLNPDAMTFSVVLALAETYGIVTFGFFLFNTWTLKHREPKPPPPGLDVDVFITTYDEPISVIRKTAVAARDIRYPHRTWLLDDGCRGEVRELAEELRIDYIPRESSEHAKAGNLNHALGLTDGEFILQLDADHVPLPHILDRMLGYFDDPDVAFVQSPQDFYNTDSYTHVVDDEGRRVWEEQRLFFNVIQPGKDHWNAAFFCGSCGVIRRKALEEIGGFSTETITEDMETSLILHGRGWKSAYVEETLAFGLSPGSAGAYQVQRLRWGQGSMQILRKFNPLTYPGLSPAQRLSYFSSVTVYLDGLLKLIFIATPLIFFATGLLPLVAVDREFLIRFFPYIFLMILAFELLARGHGYVWLSERYNMAKWPIYVRALAGYFTRERLPFAVTPKGSGQVPFRTYAPQFALLVLSPLVVIWATVAHHTGIVDYDVGGWTSPAFILSGAWVAWNAFFAWEVVRMARRLRQEEEYTFHEELPLRFHMAGRTGTDARASIGVTDKLGTRYVEFVSATRLPPDAEVRLSLPLRTGLREVGGRVLARGEEERGGVFLTRHVVELEELTMEDRVSIELHCLQEAVPIRSRRYRDQPDIFEDLWRFFRERRREDRELARLPAQIGVIEGGRRRMGWHEAVLEDLSPGGALLIVNREFEEGAWLRFHIPGIDLESAGVVAHAAPLDSPLGGRWYVGLSRRVDVLRNGTE